MVIVDASCLVEVLIGSPASVEVKRRLGTEADHVAPHLIDAEVFSVIRRLHRLDHLDRTAAQQAIDDLAAWRGERFGHRPFLPRAWELRDDVTGRDALYVGLAEALESPLLTMDARLARATGPRCPIEVLGA